MALFMSISGLVGELPKAEVRARRPCQSCEHNGSLVHYITKDVYGCMMVMSQGQEFRKSFQKYNVDVKNDIRSSRGAIDGVLIRCAATNDLFFLVRIRQTGFMVLGINTSIAACPAIIGTTEAIRQGQRRNAREQHRRRKSNLLVSCSDPSRKARDLNGGTVMLRNNKLYVTTVNPRGKAAREGRGDENEKDPNQLDEGGHFFAGYFFPYPETQWGHRGDWYVSTISDDPPQLNWIYVDKNTYEVKYGLRAQGQGNIVGPWNCTPIDKRLTLEGWEGFMVVEEEENVWALYFDRDDDGLERKMKPNKRIMEIELTRKEMRISKDELDMAEQEEELRKGDDKKYRGENETNGEKEAQKTTRRSGKRRKK